MLDKHAARIRRLVGLYRHLSRVAGTPFPALVEQLPLHRQSSFEEAAALAERLVVDWELGNVSTQRLRDACEERIDLLELFLDLPTSISGAALRLPEMGAVAINRKDPSGRRNFDFAHELFHLLTWQTLPPERIDDGRGSGSKGKRMEQLANTFASVLLIPNSLPNSMGCYPISELAPLGMLSPAQALVLFNAQILDHSPDYVQANTRAGLLDIGHW